AQDEPWQAQNAWFGVFGCCWHLRAAPKGAALRAMLCLLGTYCLYLLRAAPGGLRCAQDLFCGLT
ncbi:hypothetical protein A2U01_0051822, partial [Trifolium medium]|nr:hypothetical protein [Trifolium medium]